MAYKTILVHLNDERRVGQIIDVAGGIADREAAHLIGLYIVPSPVVGTFSSIGPRLVESGREAFREAAKRVQETFEQAMKGRSVVPEWRLVEPPPGQSGAAEAIMELGRAADLIVAGQTDPSWEYSLLLDCADRLAVESGRPTLIVPHAGRFPRCGRRIVVAWNGKREAARAVFDAMPLLKAAEAVRILWVTAKDRPTTLRDGAELAAALARHGVKCEVARSVTADVEVGDDLLSRVSDFGADMLVMGCYGHSRFREMVLGGASRSILQHMTVPVLMSH